MSSMKCTIPGVSLKVFGRAIQSLSRIGDELYFEPLEQGMFLRSVNSSRSAYACFQFSPSFFLHYVDGGSKGSDEDTDGPLRCKVGMKSIMAVFKSLSSIDKTVEKCRISLNMTEARLVFQMYCRHGIIKTHNLAFIECETLQAVFSKDLCPNKITAVPKLLCDAVLNFQNNQEEITLIVRPDSLALKNYVDDEPDPNKVVHTQLTLSASEFEQYQVGVDTDITFCLKELRAILMFADITGMPVILQFEAAGRPITFTIDSDLSFEANYVLATLSDMESSQLSQAASHSARPSLAKSSDAKRKGGPSKQSTQNGRKVPTNRHVLHSHSHTVRHSSDNHPQRSTPLVDLVRDNMASSHNANEAMEDNDDEELSMVMMDVSAPQDSIHHATDVPGCSSSVQQNESNREKNAANSRQDSGFRDADDPNNNNDNEDDEDSESWGRDVAKARNLQNPFPALSFNTRTSQNSGGDNRTPPSPIPNQRGLNLTNASQTAQNVSTARAPLQATDMSMCSSSRDSSPSLPWRLASLPSTMATEASENASPVIPLQDTEKMNDDSVQNHCEDKDDDDDEIPATPPSKKFRSVFFGTQSSTQPSQSHQKAAILALDSDEDD